MVRLSSNDLAEVGEISAELGTLVEGAPPALGAILPKLTELLDADASCSYGLSVDDEHAQLDFLHLHQLDPAFPEQLGSFLSTAPIRFGYYNPVSPEPAQRNRALRFVDLPSINENAPLRRIFFPRHGLGGHDQLRVLLCEGGAMLAWIGAFRHHPFGERERELLAALVPSLLKRATLERQLGQAQFVSAALGAALEALPAAAFILDGRGSIAHGNAAGMALHSQGARELEHLLRECLACRDSSFTLTRFESPGIPEHYLAVRRLPAVATEARAALAARRWHLSERQLQVLSLLAAGRANKTIAAELGLAERTVEVHVSSLLQKAGCSTRAELVARLWELG